MRINRLCMLHSSSASALVCGELMNRSIRSIDRLFTVGDVGRIRPWDSAALKTLVQYLRWTHGRIYVPCTVYAEVRKHSTVHIFQGIRRPGLVSRSGPIVLYLSWMRNSPDLYLV